MKEKQKQLCELELARQTPATLLESKIQKAERRARVMMVVKAVLLIAGLTYALFGHILGLGLVRGNSMHPAMQEGDFFIYLRPASSFEVGDIVVYEQESGDLRVKRVVGIEGDVLDINRQGDLLIDGEISNTEIFYETKVVPGGLQFPYRVSECELVLMGDKRDTSLDSRELGAVPLKQVKGKVLSLFRVGIA